MYIFKVVILLHILLATTIVETAFSTISLSRGRSQSMSSATRNIRRNWCFGILQYDQSNNNNITEDPNDVNGIKNTF